MTDEKDSGINAGIPFGEARNIHLDALYDIRRRIASVVESAGMTHTMVDYDIVQALVEAAISLLPDIDQANKCRHLMEKYEEEEAKRIAAEHKREYATSEERQMAKRFASFAIMNVVQVIYDEDIGIRRRFTIGVA